MVLVIAFIFASATFYNPAIAQRNYATAFAEANAVSTGGTASASAYSYASNKNGVYNCTYDRCTPTCSVPSPKNCPLNSNPCNCPQGTITSEEGGKCVPAQECQKYSSCNGDYNATYTDCPVSCPSTCALPNSQYCNTRCGTPRCECNSGYLLSSLNGTCIKPEDCPGGKVCQENEVFMSCLVECPDLYCPEDENRVACGLAVPCLSACACKSGYLRRSVDDYTCIPVSKCPPGRCSRPNEEWNSCESPCFSDSCEDRNKARIPEDCPFSPTECIPRCLCKQGFYRDARKICVPVGECPSASQ